MITCTSSSSTRSPSCHRLSLTASFGTTTATAQPTFKELTLSWYAAKVLSFLANLHSSLHCLHFPAMIWPFDLPTLSATKQLLVDPLTDSEIIEITHAFQLVPIEEAFASYDDWLTDDASKVAQRLHSCPKPPAIRVISRCSNQELLASRRRLAAAESAFAPETAPVLAGPPRAPSVPRSASGRVRGSCFEATLENVFASEYGLTSPAPASILPSTVAQRLSVDYEEILGPAPAHSYGGSMSSPLPRSALSTSEFRSAVHSSFTFCHPDSSIVNRNGLVEVRDGDMSARSPQSVIPALWNDVSSPHHWPVVGPSISTMGSTKSASLGFPSLRPVHRTPTPLKFSFQVTLGLGHPQHRVLGLPSPTGVSKTAQESSSVSRPSDEFNNHPKRKRSFEGPIVDRKRQLSVNEYDRRDEAKVEVDAIIKLVAESTRLERFEGGLQNPLLTSKDLDCWTLPTFGSFESLNEKYACVVRDAQCVSSREMAGPAVWAAHSHDEDFKATCRINILRTDTVFRRAWRLAYLLDLVQGSQEDWESLFDLKNQTSHIPGRTSTRRAGIDETFFYFHLVNTRFEEVWRVHLAYDWVTWKWQAAGRPNLKKRKAWWRAVAVVEKEEASTPQWILDGSKVEREV